MEYNFRAIEQKWQKHWEEEGIYKVSNNSSKPKYYVLDMFPYPSGAGLHVGHPLGYIASDIYARFKRLKGFNVLHPMGYDAFGLPAEQYAIEHGVHPADSTKKNIATFRSQLDKIGFCFDWSREVNTSDPTYYKWTQWIFLQLFKSWYNKKSDKAEPIETLIAIFEKEGNKTTNYQPSTTNFSAKEWNAFTEKEQQDILMNHRLCYCGYGEVNWCEALGTVLANDEVVNGVSERGGYPVVKKKLRQWYLRITDYADRLLKGLETVNFSDAMKEMQSNWIGKSYGAEIDFPFRSDKFATVEDKQGRKLKVYTTRPDTIFGVDFMVVAPEHELIDLMTTDEQREAVDEYIAYVKSRSERERMAEKKISGVFTGGYAINQLNNQHIPIWISEYVLAGYGTGAIMAVPCGDERDFKFAKHFNIPITNIIGDHFNGEEANPTKDAALTNSDFLTGMIMRDAIEVIMTNLEGLGTGKRKVNYKMRDAAFSRQRYWGEPFPIKWIDGIACPLDESELPLELPHIEKYGPGPEGEGPLSNVSEWTAQHLETNTMPGYAGSSWYFLRYMDPHDNETFCNKSASDYWNQVDVYVGGTEHAVGHLLYSRMWTKFLYDTGAVSFEEPFKRLVNQGMIQGSSRFVYRISSKGAEFLLSNILRKHFPNYDFKQHPFNGVNDYDFHSAIENISIEISTHTKIKRSFQRAVETESNAYTTLIFLSNEEFLTYLSKGQTEVIQWLKNLFDSDKNYCSDTDKNKTFFISKSLILNNNIEDFNQIHVDVNIVDGVELDIEAFKKWRNNEYANSDFVLEDGKYICGVETEKMSKSKFNTVNPDDLVNRYGADTFRMYEMFLGPVEQSKPWDTKGIEGVHRFLKKLWRLFNDEVKGNIWNEEKATPAELKILHKAIKKIEDDTERFSFNTAVSAFMVCVNELSEAKCNKREVLEPLLILLTPYAPHIAEELWHELGNTSSILDANYPAFEEKYLVESTKEYPVSINGKLRATIVLPLDIAQSDAEAQVLNDEKIKKWTDGNNIKKFIFVKGKMINVVV